MKTLQTTNYTNVETITSGYDYNQVVLNIADSVISAINEAIESGDCEFDSDSVEGFLHDSCLNETIDGCEWAIYNHHHLPIIQHSDNVDYAVDNFGSEWAGDLLKSQGLDGLHASIAFYALYEDVRDVVQDIINDTDFDVEDEENEG
jgi:hypothetical protein